jgi:hypothetical protein
MKTTPGKGKIAMGFAGVVVLLLAGAAAQAQGRLEGTWAVTVTQQDCQSGAQIGDPFLSLLTFAEGGTMTETTSNPMFYPSERGPGHGVWHATGRKTYKASSIALITLNGALTTMQTIAQTIAIGDDPDTFQTTKATVKFLTPDGTVVRTGCATAVGARFQ